MYHGVYVLWALLPLILLSLSVWAVIKRWAKIPGRENAQRYFQQFIYSVICLILAIMFDQYMLEGILDTLFAGMIDEELTFSTKRSI